MRIINTEQYFQLHCLILFLRNKEKMLLWGDDADKEKYCAFSKEAFSILDSLPKVQEIEVEDWIACVLRDRERNECVPDIKIDCPNERNLIPDDCLLRKQAVLISLAKDIKDA